MTRDELDQALCKEYPHVDFFPVDRMGLFEARLVCNRCPVQRACLDHALAHREEHGVWGGTSERERVRMRKGRPRPKPSARDMVAAAVARNPGRWMTVPEVQRSAALGSHITVGQHLRNLANDGVLEREIGQPNKGNRYRWVETRIVCSGSQDPENADGNCVSNAGR